MRYLASMIIGAFVAMLVLHTLQDRINHARAGFEAAAQALKQ